MKTKITYTKPSISDLEIRYVNDAIKNGWGENCYRYIDKFETAFKNYIGSKYAIATSSATGALHLGLAALGLGPGDEVIIADTNWVASVAPVMYMGAHPIFIDIKKDTWCIDEQLIENAISPNTKAIIAVHLYGNTCNLNKIRLIAEKYNIPVIEDAAEAIGSAIGNHRVGSLGKFGVFSFHGTKTLTTGEGGMLVTDDDALFEKALMLSNHGRSKTQSRYFCPEILGYKYKMSNIQAAIGLGQLERVSDLIAKKRANFLFYKDVLGGLSGVMLNPEPEGTTNGYWMPTICFSKEMNVDINGLQKHFLIENIDARPFFSPLSSLPFFTNKTSNTVSYDLPSRAINLPSFHDMNSEELTRVCNVITNYIKTL